MVNTVFPFIGVQASKIQGRFRSFIASRRARAAVNSYPRDPKLGIGVIDFSEIEKNALVEKKDDEAFDQDDTLRSPRRLLETMIPARSDQIARMDSLLTSRDRQEVHALRTFAWNGISNTNRPIVWRKLLRYEALNKKEQDKLLQTKRKSYQDLVKKCLEQVEEDIDSGGFDYTPRSYVCGALRQIELDLARTHAEKRFFQIQDVRDALRRCLVVFSLTRAELGYVQGMNEIMALLYVVLITEHFAEGCKQVEDIVELHKLPETIGIDRLNQVEADAFWCFAAVINRVYDNFAVDQPGIHSRVEKIHDVLKLVDITLTKHFKRIGLQLMQFAFRWMNCLWVRECSFGVAAQMWDVFIAEEDGFSEFQVYFCAAFIVECRDELLTMDFQDAIMFLQHLPSDMLTSEKVGIMISQAFLWRKQFDRKIERKKTDEE